MRHGPVQKEIIGWVYAELLKAHGKQGWWPVTEAGASSPSYCGGPVSDRQVFEVMAGAILTQNTAWKNVERALAALQRERLLDPHRLLSVKEDRLAAVIRPSGYFNQKAKKLKALSEFVMNHPIEELRRTALPRLRTLLLEVKGIGPETADSIILYGLGKPVFVVDAYTKRIFSRIGLLPQDASYQDVQGMFHSALPQRTRRFNEYHALLVKHGKDVCRKRPLCAECILQKRCKRVMVLDPDVENKR
jgi:endonuclease III related protein